MLIVVLWVMGLVGLGIGTVVARSTHELRLGRVPFGMLQREAIAQAAVQQATALLEHDDPSVDHLEELWATGREPGADTQWLQHIAVGPGFFSVGRRLDDGFAAGLVDEERKLNLNAAPLEQLTRLIHAVQTTDLDVDQVVAAIADWRDEPAGAICSQAQMQCHNGPFDSVEELRLVPGVTPELFAGLEPYVTVYGSGQVNSNTASATVLNAIGCRGERLVQQRTDAPFTTPPAECPGSTVQSAVFTVPVEVELPDAAGQLRVRAVVDRHGATLAWIRGD